MNTAIIVAAGRGSRFGSDLPKQFLDLAGKPVIQHSIERFVEAEVIDDIVVVISGSHKNRVADILGSISSSKVLRVVEGGSSRSISVRNGLASCTQKSGIIAVHDAARPLVSIAEINTAIRAAEGSGAACLTTAVTDTIKSVSNGNVTGTLDRSMLRQALTPQCFKVELLRRAFDEVSLDDGITDECMLVEKLGVTITSVEGSGRNIKITSCEDLLMAEALLRSVYVSSSV